MCELNYKGTKIEIRVKLGDQIIILPTKNEVFIGNYSDADTWQSWQSTYEVNGQRLN